MRDILNSHSVTDLKKEISKTNIVAIEKGEYIKGYSKFRKSEVVVGVSFVILLVGLISNLNTLK